MANDLNLQTTYSAILAAARKGDFISYGDLVKANGANFRRERHNLNRQLGDLIELAAMRDWPLLTAIVVTQENIKTGKLDDKAEKGFVDAAKKFGLDVDDIATFIKKQQSAVFRWASEAPKKLDLSDTHEEGKITSGGPKFVQFFGSVLDALRNLGGSAKTRQVIEKVIDFADVTEDELKEMNKNNRSKYENKVRWAIFYLGKAGLLDNKKRGLWMLTPEGRETYLDHESALALYKRISANYSDTANDDEAIAPEVLLNKSLDLFKDPKRRFWFVGATWGEKGDQTENFLKKGIWQNGYKDKFVENVALMKLGDRIAIKSAFTKKYGLPFDNHEKSVSCMRIKAIGTITEATKDGQTVKVKWTKLEEAKEWYFYTYRIALVEADTSDSHGRKLIQFAFGDSKQDYNFFLHEPYWAKKYLKDATETIADLQLDEEEAETDVEETIFEPYKIANIIKDGCFLPEANLKDYLTQLSKKKSLILQGAPGTGKTWLAKRLAYALIGTKESKLTNKRMRVIQFHPSFSYEDFVRGWRPSGDGQLKLTDGVFLEAVEAARAERDRDFVVVIEEINRGNPAQIFGEMLTLLEKDKRHSDEAIELAYRKKDGERVYIPDNLHVIGTMNLADRSLALVDLAFRRRFAFVTLETMLNRSWMKWCGKAGLNKDVIKEIQKLMNELNEEIVNDRSLGKQFRIGHSFVTPAKGEKIRNPTEWFRHTVETEIKPLLEEYWFDDLEKATTATKKLLKDW